MLMHDWRKLSILWLPLRTLTEFFKVLKLTMQQCTHEHTSTTYCLNSSWNNWEGVSGDMDELSGGYRNCSFSSKQNTMITTNIKQQLFMRLLHQCHPTLHLIQDYIVWLFKSITKTFWWILSITYHLVYNFIFGFILFISLNFKKSWRFMFTFPDFYLL